MNNDTIPNNSKIIQFDGEDEGAISKKTTQDQIEGIKDVQKSDDFKLWYSRGNELFDTCKFNDAIKYYDKVINGMRNNSEVWHKKGTLSDYGLGVALIELDQYNHAIQCFDEAIRQNSENYLIFYDKGTKFLTHYQVVPYVPQVNTKKPLKILMKQLDCNLIYQNQSQLKDLLQTKLEKQFEAIKYFDQVIKLNPFDSEPWQYKGEALCKLNQYEEALKCFDETLRLDPSNLTVVTLKNNTLQILKEKTQTYGFQVQTILQQLE